MSYTFSILKSDDSFCNVTIPSNSRQYAEEIFAETVSNPKFKSEEFDTKFTRLAGENLKSEEYRDAIGRAWVMTRKQQDQILDEDWDTFH